MKIKILVTGANGQLGNCLREIAEQTEHDFVFTDFEELDITDEKTVQDFVKQQQPDWIVNAAAYTAVDKAEGDLEKARLLNATAVGYLAKAAKNVEAGIVHISTDYVFKGDNPNPLTEEEMTAPVSAYGKTKLEGEILVQEYNADHIIIRTAWLYSIFGNNFVKTMQRLGAEKESLSVVSDQWGSPTSAHDLAKAILTAVEKPIPGIYHFTNEGVTNWALFAEEIMTLSALKCEIKHIATEEYPTPAKRPEYSILSKKKFKDTFKITIPEWEVSLEEVINKLKQKTN